MQFPKLSTQAPPHESEWMRAPVRYATSARFQSVPPLLLRYSRPSPISSTTSFAPGACPSPPLRPGPVKPAQSANGEASPASDPDVCVPWPLPPIVAGHVLSSPVGVPDQL